MSIIISLPLHAQPGIEWQFAAGGSQDDYAMKVVKTMEGGLVIGGFSSSGYGFFTDNSGTFDAWVVKLKATGELQWKMRLAGSGDDRVLGLLQMPDSSFVAVGQTSSGDSDFVHNKGGVDGWIARISKAGELLWLKTLGGSGTEVFRDVAMYSNQIVVGGYTNSTDGDTFGSGFSGVQYGQQDFWVLFLDNTGNIIRHLRYGGPLDDVLQSVTPMADGYHFVLTGYTQSNGGQISGTKGLRDYWVVKINGSGSMIWQKCLGGSNEDLARGACATPDGGVAIIGQSYSQDGDISNPKGTNDFWVVKLNQSGEMLWQQSLGGSQEDRGFSISALDDGQLTAVGFSQSVNGDVTANHGGYDYWVARLTANGLLLWQKSLGGEADDRCESSCLSADGGVVMAGYSNSNGGDFSGNQGGYDWRIAKLEAAGACVFSSAPVIDGPADRVALGDTVVLRIKSGNLNSATDWAWYSGMCGSQLLGTGDSLRVVYQSTEPALHFQVRGEGGCVTQALCGGFSVYRQGIGFVFTGNGNAAGNWTDTANWLSRLYPGNYLFEYDSLRIQGTAPSGTICTLDTNILSSGQVIQVNKGNRFHILPGRKAEFKSFTSHQFIIERGAAMEVDGEWIGYGSMIDNQGRLRIAGNVLLSFDEYGGGSYVHPRLENYGSIEVAGRLTLEGVYTVNTDTIRILPAGRISAHWDYSSSAHPFRNEGFLENAGDLIISDVRFYNAGKVLNHQYMEVHWMQSTGSIDNHGMLANPGYDNINYPGGVTYRYFSNTGPLWNTGTINIAYVPVLNLTQLNNTGKTWVSVLSKPTGDPVYVPNASLGEITNTGEFRLHSAWPRDLPVFISGVTNLGVWESKGVASIAGNVQNQRQFYHSGPVLIAPGSEVNNQGKFTVEGWLHDVQLPYWGIFIEAYLACRLEGTLHNQDTLTLKGKTDIQSSGSLINRGYHAIEIIPGMISPGGKNPRPAKAKLPSM